MSQPAVFWTLGLRIMDWWRSDRLNFAGGGRGARPPGARLSGAFFSGTCFSSGALTDGFGIPLLANSKALSLALFSFGFAVVFRGASCIFCLLMAAKLRANSLTRSALARCGPNGKDKDRRRSAAKRGEHRSGSQRYFVPPYLGYELVGVQVRRELAELHVSARCLFAVLFQSARLIRNRASLFTESQAIFVRLDELLVPLLGTLYERRNRNKQSMNEWAKPVWRLLSKTFAAMVTYRELVRCRTPNGAVRWRWVTVTGAPSCTASVMALARARGARIRLVPVIFDSVGRYILVNFEGGGAEVLYVAVGMAVAVVPSLFPRVNIIPVPLRVRRDMFIERIILPRLAFF